MSRRTWHVVQEVKGANGGTRYKARPKHRRGSSTRTSWPTSTYALQQVVRNGTGTEARSLGRPAAAKTGTAALRPDTTTSAWFVGYTPQLAAAVDFYKGTGKADLDGVGGLSTFFGGEYPARIWTAFMTAALQGKDVEEFPPRADVGEAVNPQPTFTPTPSESPTTETPTRDTDSDRHGDDRAAADASEPPSTPPGQQSPHGHRVRRGHDRRRTGTPGRGDPTGRARRPVARRPRRTARQRGRRRAARRRARADVACVVDAGARARRADLPHLRAGARAEGLVPGPRLGGARRLHATPATATSRRCTSAAVSPTARCRTSARTADRQVEYPVLTGAVMCLTAKLVPAGGTPDERSRWYFDINALGARTGRRGRGGRDRARSPGGARGTRPWSRRACARPHRHDQLGPVRRRAARPGHAGVGARETVGRRRAHRARARPPSSTRCSSSARCCVLCLRAGRMREFWATLVAAVCGWGPSTCR